MGKWDSMKLTDKAVRSAKPEFGRVVKLFDGGGLHLRVTPAGTKSWKYKFTRAGKEQLLTFGVYPDTTLRKEAARTIDTLWSAIGRLVDLITPAECVNMFAAAGYDPE